MTTQNSLKEALLDKARTAIELAEAGLDKIKSIEVSINALKSPDLLYPDSMVQIIREEVSTTDNYARTLCSIVDEYDFKALEQFNIKESLWKEDVGEIKNKCEIIIKNDLKNQLVDDLDDLSKSFKDLKQEDKEKIVNNLIGKIDPYKVVFNKSFTVFKNIKDSLVKD